MSGAHVFIHESQFPTRVRRDLIESLRSREINQKFHYDTYKQAEKWLALHEMYSPAQRDPSCQRAYDDAFTAATALTGSGSVHVIALGCGGGQKEASLLRVLNRDRHEIAYTPSDVSLPLVLAAWAEVETLEEPPQCYPVVCDIATAADLTETIDAQPTLSESRIVTFFGLLPNFEPELLLSRITALLRPDDVVLLSVNLAPGNDYDSSVRSIVPQYDNELTRQWLMTFLLDLGIESSDGTLRFDVESGKDGLKRIVADFVFSRERVIPLYGEQMNFNEGESIRLFFSWRHTEATLSSLLGRHKMEVQNRWLNASGEEGVFLCRKR